MTKGRSYNKGCWGRWCARLMMKKKKLLAENKRQRTALEEIKTAADKSQRDIFYYLKAEQGLKGN